MFEALNGSIGPFQTLIQLGSWHFIENSHKTGGIKKAGGARGPPAQLLTLHEKAKGVKGACTTKQVSWTAQLDYSGNEGNSGFLLIDQDSMRSNLHPGSVALVAEIHFREQTHRTSQK